jgi:hypothetical protein
MARLNDSDIDLETLQLRTKGKGGKNSLSGSPARYLARFVLFLSCEQLLAHRYDR